MGLKTWRKKRPLWGALLTVISGLMILWIPLNLYLSTFLPGSIAIIGLFFGGMIILIGILAFIFPSSSRILGVMTIFLSILSVIGALGGFLFGTILGIIGGALLTSWQLAPAKSKSPRTNPIEESVHTF
jgi:MFS family permease